METLGKILKQEVVVMNEQIELKKLQKQYIKEYAKFKKGDSVLFFKYSDDKILTSAEIVSVNYKPCHEKGLLRYCIFCINKDGSKNMRDRSFYYRYECELQARV